MKMVCSKLFVVSKSNLFAVLERDGHVKQA